ncbi:CBF-domain-containing protein [Sistotremastrum niveocremeum HHB9708]|uniref:CBF-domain-containing protein n=1 Tax=Sistotremastrum niveocremeum HHB9708 TaxID=1314777 RepID=A0A164ZXZ0_9AGAM|nr:CBF-domain-containing protein [Sistotremastrum niveocremeum HHB9708]
MSTTSLPARKKRKLSETHASEANEDTIATLEKSLMASAENTTSVKVELAKLVKATKKATDPEITHKGIYALYRVFVSLASSGRLVGTQKADNEEKKALRNELLKQLKTYGEFLSSLLKDQEESLHIAALQILMSVLKHLSTAVSKSSGQPQIHMIWWRCIVQGLTLCPLSLRPSSTSSSSNRALISTVRDQFVDTWFSVHDDIRWFFLRDTGNLLKPGATVDPQVPENIFSILEKLNTMPTDASELNEFWIPAFAKAPSDSGPGAEIPDDDEEDDWRKSFDEPDGSEHDNGTGKGNRVYRLSTLQSLHSLTSHRVQFTVCWFALLPHLSGSMPLCLRVLNILHRGIMPHLTRPLRLNDWIGGCVDLGGSIGLLALNSLFTLMQEYNLDYPSFYTKLYAFLDSDVLHLKHRSRFFRLAELFLSSTHLPSTLLASFLKRLSRLSLSAPPAALVAIIPFTYNIMKRHPALMCLVHRRPSINESTGLPENHYVDPFNPDETSPLLTNALDSCLWELVSMKNHYQASVAILARIFEEQFTKPQYALEDFLDHTYGTLFTTEIKKRIKADPALAMEHIKDLFPGKQIAPREGDKETLISATDLVSEIWTFG